jgi:hypothetical protein
MKDNYLSFFLIFPGIFVPLPAKQLIYEYVVLIPHIWVMVFCDWFHGNYIQCTVIVKGKKKDIVVPVLN